MPEGGHRSSLGFAKPGEWGLRASEFLRGLPDRRKVLRLADPHAQTGFGYVTNQMGTHLLDPREEALRKAMYSSIGENDAY